ncbi:hypothetical protein [Coleofasciculus sp.]|uniref:hypothetical protein n=1 Tax=Coleofasciculus sp. TaxID=3100458 RepID=UPI003A14656C
MQSLRHGFAKRITTILQLLALRFKCRTAYYTDVETYPGTSVGAGFTDNLWQKLIT